MPIETGMYANQTQVNPLEAITKAAGAVSAVQENQLTGQKLAARHALGDILARSTNPDGSINYSNAVSEATKDPNAALIVPDLQAQRLASNAPVPYYDNNKKQIMIAPSQNMGNVMNPEGNKINLQPIPLQQLHREHETLDAMLVHGENLLGNDKLRRNDITNSVTDLVKSEHISPQEAMQILSSMPKGPNGEEAPPEVYNNYVTKQVTALKQHKEGLKRAYGDPIDEEHHESIVNGSYSGNQGVGAGAPLGTEQALKESGEYSDVARAASETLPPLRRALEIANSSDFNTGNLEPAIAEIYGQLADLGLATKGATDQASKMQEIKKYLAQSLQGTSAGDKNMQEFLNSSTATPNPAMLKEALLNTLHSTIAQNQAAIIKNGYLAKQNLTSLEDIRKAKQELNKVVDPRIIQLESASPEDAKILIKKFKKSGELKNIMGKYKKMEEMGLLQEIP